MEKTFNLENLLQITLNYAEGEEANNTFGTELRAFQAVTSQISLEEITEVTEKTLLTVAEEWIPGPAQNVQAFYEKVSADYKEKYGA